MASNGQGCPCLDLGRLPRDLCQAAHSADLVILEGMGRAILTNFQARFSVAALKVCCCARVRFPAEWGCELVCGGLAPAQLRAGWCRWPSGATAGRVLRCLGQLLADPSTHQLIGLHMILIADAN